RIETRVLGPGPEIPAGDPHVHAREAHQARHPRLIERVGERDFAQLHEARVLETRLVDARERTGGEAARAIPVLADRDLETGARAGDRSRITVRIAERVEVARAARV